MIGTRRRAGMLFASMLMVAFAMPVSARAATTGTGDWPMFIDGPAHNGNNRAETVLSPSTVPGLVVTHSYSWWVAVGNEFAGAYPVTSGGLGASFVNGTTGDHLVLDVFNIPAGTLRWHHIVASGDTTPAVPEPAFSGSDIFAGAGSTINAYNATSGHLLWSRAGAVGDHFNAITVWNGVIYADEYGSTTAVYALNATSGAVVWSTTLPECCSLAAVSVAKGVAYVSAEHLWAFNATTGAHVFTTSAATNGTTPAVSNGVVYVQNSSTLSAFNATTGTPLWSTATQEPNPTSAFPVGIAVDGSTIVLTTTEAVRAFNASTGGSLWIDDSGNSSTNYRAPSIANGVVYAGSTGLGLQAFRESDGGSLYSHACLGNSSPIVSQGSVYLDCGGPMTVFGLPS